MVEPWAPPARRAANGRVRIGDREQTACSRRWRTGSRCVAVRRRLGTAVPVTLASSCKHFKVPTANTAERVLELPYTIQVVRRLPVL